MITTRANVKTIFRTIPAVAVLLTLAMAREGAANVAQVKNYKAAFPGSQPKCLFCHVDKLPKKEEGKHDPNAYGLKIREAKGSDEKITAETYKKIGTVEDFEAQQNQNQETGE